MTSIFTDLMEKLKKTWKNDLTVKDIIQDLMANLISHPLYQWKDHILYRKKGRLWWVITLAY